MRKPILVIDDDDRVRAAFADALGSAGYEVELAASGEEGARKALAADYDLVYLDMRMPDKDGIAVLRDIRAQKPDLLVYIVTAFHREFFIELAKARNEGLKFELLAKPLERNQITSITRGILEGVWSSSGGPASD